VESRQRVIEITNGSSRSSASTTASTINVETSDV
jgi:hypothetical protein